MGVRRGPLVGQSSWLSPSQRPSRLVEKLQAGRPQGQAGEDACAPTRYERFSALRTARTEASSMFVSTPAPQRDLPSAPLIWM